MDNAAVQKASLISLTVMAITGGLKIAETNVWAGVLIIVVGLVLPYIREYLKK